mmetsp:Transcript_33275/g.54978  ORF Transcript_33275/g.54978 Transcript_33275/m.54978 type:complete len:539 (+) Transcript_33275:78-1694(+)
MLHLSACLATVAPRLPDSPFPVSQQPTDITLWNITTSNFDERVLALSAVGIVAQRRPDLATVDAADSRGAALGAWHLSLLPAKLDTSIALEPEALLRRFASDFRGYILCESGGQRSNNSMHVAVGLAGVLAALVVTPSTVALAEAAGLKMVVDARTLSLEESFMQHGANFSKTLLFNQQHANLVYTTDFAVYAKAFALYDATLTGPLSHRALARLSPISMVLGWASEVEFVTSASRHGHQVLCSDFTTNVPVYSNFAPPRVPLPPPPHECSTSSTDEKHTVAFMFTDGDSITWDLGNFISPAFDWWGSAARGKAPITWTFQPMLQELHPYFLHWIHKTKAEDDVLIAGPSGAGYTYLDQYPSAGNERAARARFANWSAVSIAQAGFTNMVNQIQVGLYSDSVEYETLDAQPAPPAAVFVDEEVQLSIKGAAWRVRDAKGRPTDTVVTSRRHCLSNTFGDVTPDSLVEILNHAPADPTSTSSYSVVGVEVWSYGVNDIVAVVARLNASRVRVVGTDEYVACLKQHALPISAKGRPTENK